MTKLVWHAGAVTDVGKIRDINEDSYFASRSIIAVADGVGGAAAGEIASSLAIDEVKKLREVSASDDAEAVAEQVAAAVDSAREHIQANVEENPESEGMGTTLTALVIKDDQIHLAHIGDSRAYQLRGDDFVQITTDDSYVQHLIDEGAITKDEAIDHPYRSVVTRVLQSKPAPAHFEARPAKLGDRYLVCSDGLSDVVREETIEEVLREYTEPKPAAKRLVELALRAGGPDNITVVVADIAESSASVKDQVVYGGAIASVFMVAFSYGWWAIG